MAACSHPARPADACPPVTIPRAARLLKAVRRYFSRSVVTRESVDRAWLDAGLGRLDAATLADVGASPGLREGASLGEAWRLAAALDATRHL